MQKGKKKIKEKVNYLLNDIKCLFLDASINCEKDKWNNPIA